VLPGLSGAAPAPRRGARERRAMSACHR
jgi:hypothetical protein